MSKRMLIDDTHPEETRVVVLNGNKLEDVEFESSGRKQIKANVYLAKVMRVEPSLQAAFVDYGGNRHGFLAFAEIHPDYYNVSPKAMADIEKEVDDSIESKKQQIKDREQERARVREEKFVKRTQPQPQPQTQTQTQTQPQTQTQTQTQPLAAEPESPVEETTGVPMEQPSATATEPVVEEVKEEAKAVRTQKRRGRKPKPKTDANKEEKPIVMAESLGISEESVSEDDEVSASDDDDDDGEYDFDTQRKLMIMRKLFYGSKIQEVIKEGQILLVQVVKEERGNKGAALTTYLSLAGRYCVLMPNRIKSGGVSRKITNAADRKRLKSIVKELPISNEMSLIVRTAGEEKTKPDIVRDYNYLIRTWTEIRAECLQAKAPSLIYEEGNLIKRALRDMFTKEISEIIIDGDEAYKAARNLMKILSPQSLKKLKSCRSGDAPLFQRFQVESQLDKLHDINVQLDSGGYLVINPTEALVSIDVNSGRATKEKDLEETAVKTNLEAADEIAKQLRLRNLAGLVVIDFIDMDDGKNDQAVERRMKEAMKKDRARVQIGKMSQFGLLEISRQRMHSSFFESNYQTCPYCSGRGIVRTVESAAMSVLRIIEEEGNKNRSSRLNVLVTADVALYLLNQKREVLVEMEKRYKMSVIISADSSIKNVSDSKIEKIKRPAEEEVKAPAASVAVGETAAPVDQVVEEVAQVVESDGVESKEGSSEEAREKDGQRRGRRTRFDRRRRNNNRPQNGERAESVEAPQEPAGAEDDDKKKVRWWKKLITP